MAWTMPGMAPNFIGCDREQGFLLPPSLCDWVAEDHLVWTILGAVEEMDLCDFYADYRADGHGRPAYDPAMMVALLLYAYARGNRSSRGIERECREDVAYRVICANHVPDHSTIAEFRVRHEAALAELFTSVLSLCRRAGLVRVGVVAIDGTKIAANAARTANRGYEQIAREILAEAAETDRREDELYGEARGDELPERLRTRAGRRAALREAKEELERAGAGSPKVVIADAGYWHKRQMENVVCRGIQVLIPPDSGLRTSARPGWAGGLYAFMRRVLSTDPGKALYQRRHATIEPVFGQMKFNRRLDRFLRRGRSAVRSEWRLFGASHNLLKLHNHRTAAAAT